MIKKALSLLPFLLPSPCLKAALSVETEEEQHIHTEPQPALSTEVEPSGLAPHALHHDDPSLPPIDQPLEIKKKPLDDETQQAFFQACRKGDLKEVQTIYNNYQVDINATDEFLETPLRKAAYAGQTKIVDFLIKADADVNAKNRSLYTALAYAVFRDNKEIVRLLIKADADVNAQDKYGAPLHLTVEDGKKEIAKLLIDAGADVNAQDEYGRTPLHLTVYHGREELAKLLIDAGANVHAEDECEKTPLDWADMSECAKGVVNFIKEAIAHKIELTVSGYVREMEETMEEESSNLCDQRRNIYPIVLRFYVDDTPQEVDDKPQEKK